MLNACPEHPDISHILRTGEPPRQTYPERDDVVELTQEEYADIVENRSKQSDER